MSNTVDFTLIVKMCDIRLNLGFIYLILTFSFCMMSSRIAAREDYGLGFYNHSGCLYAYQEDGNFTMITDDGEEIVEKLSVANLDYNETISRCTDMGENGKLVFSFRIGQSRNIELEPVIKSVVISMAISTLPSKGVWIIQNANLTISRRDKRRTFQLKVRDHYAGLGYSYSCNVLKLDTFNKKKSSNTTAHATITLRRFQLQPFEEQIDSVFASSYDCSTWVSITGFMGFTLIVFITIVTVIGVSFLQRIETNDFKFQKEGLLFTQAQMESSKHQT